MEVVGAALEVAVAEVVFVVEVLLQPTAAAAVTARVAARYPYRMGLLPFVVNC